MSNTNSSKTRTETLINIQIKNSSKTQRARRKQNSKQDLNENFNKLMPLLRLLRDRDIGDATTASMTSILRDREAALQLELAGILDVRVLVRTTYELEGDRLEVLLVFRRIEELRAIGRSLSANEDGVLPNVDAALRARAELKNGLEISK